MNKTQRENLAKYSYDLSKLVFAGFVIANIMSERFSISLIVFGIVATLILLLIGYI